MIAAILAMGVMHRYLTIQVYAAVGYAPTYNAARGFDPRAAMMARYEDALMAGFAHDAVFAIVAGIAAAMLPRAAVYFGLGGLAAFYAANVAHVAANLGWIDLRFVGLAMDGTFVSAHLTPEVLALMVRFFLLGASVAVLLRHRPLRILTGAALIPVVVAAGVVLPGAFRLDAPLLLQTHPLLPALSGARLPTEERTFADSAFVPPPVAAAGAARHNLLVVYLEGVSRHSIEKAGMTHLAALAEDGTDFTRYLGHQIVTANGLDSSLTGRVPRFLSGGFRWDDGPGAPETALPARLKALGYRTSFLQGADLGYMAKDVHMSALGYETLMGAGTWDDAPVAARNGWGIDDLTLFGHVLDHIDAQPSGHPWHVGVLTSGTHAPYNVPDAFLPEVASDRLRALRYADRAVGELMDGLARRGLLEETVVIFTSDESRESSDRPGADNDVLLNWLPLIVSHPDGDARRIDVALANSAMPALAMAMATGPVPHRAVLARAGDRPIVFGNAVLRRVFWYDPTARTLLACHMGRELACEERAEVQDPVRPSEGHVVREALFPGLADALLRHE